MKHVVIAAEAGAAHACELCNGLEKYVGVHAVWHHKSSYGLDDIYPKAKIGIRHIPRRGENIIVIGAVWWKLIDMSFLDNYEHVTVIVPDGNVMRETEKYNLLFQEYDVYTTNCKYQFFNYPVKEYYQPFDLNWVKIKKNRDVTVSHGYFSNNKKKQKGTDYIEHVLQNKNVQTDLFTRMSWEESVIRKSKSHIYIDQIDHFDGYKFGWMGGIGKSGLEAMLLDTVVVCRGEFHDREIPTPPIAWATKDMLSDVLDEYIGSKRKRKRKIEEQREWANKYLNKDFCARHVLRL